MALQIGIIGMGGMGNFHFRCYAKMKGVKVVAICDIEPRKMRPDVGARINVGAAGERKDLSGVRTYFHPRDLIADPNVQAVDICLPTFLHARHAIQALEAGKHVICEKPMAISAAEAERMAAAAKKAKRQLFIAHCIRFWPAYAAAREIMQSGKYGRVLSAIFVRIGGTPLWSWQNWFLDAKKSGGAALDLHIHDADYILYTFGKPRAVRSSSSGLVPGRIDHIVTCYEYPSGALIMAEGGWDYTGKYPFSASFRIAMEKASLDLAPDGQLRLFKPGRDAEKVKIAAGDGYMPELEHFVQCIGRNRPSPIIPPEDALLSVRLVESEVESARTGKAVKII